MAPILRPLPSSLWWGASAGALPSHGSSLRWACAGCVTTWRSGGWGCKDRWAKAPLKRSKTCPRALGPRYPSLAHGQDHPRYPKWLLTNLPSSPKAQPSLYVLPWHRHTGNTEFSSEPPSPLVTHCVQEWALQWPGHGCHHHCCCCCFLRDPNEYPPPEWRV